MDDKRTFEIESTTSVLEQVSKRLDKNLNLQFIFSFIALLFVFDETILQKTIRISPLDIEVSAGFLRILMPAILLKLFMDWSLDSYEYILVRCNMGRLLVSEGLGDRWELVVPSSAYKYIYNTQSMYDNESKLSILASRAAHFGLTAVVLAVISFNVGLVSYYGCKYLSSFLPTAAILISIVLFYGVYYLINFKALRDVVNVWWYRPYLVILAFGNLIAVLIATFHCY